MCNVGGGFGVCRLVSGGNVRGGVSEKQRKRELVQSDKREKTKKKKTNG